MPHCATLLEVTSNLQRNATSPHLKQRRFIRRGGEEGRGIFRMPFLQAATVKERIDGSI